ncbi:hypothetical protein CIPAW_13G064400 [Carya illinoinensis]|uniref:Uncharacterized protein n=1 Tax=Carya illinoinensis TaxID=32201 RepID=A0A8T1NQ67_CARIL|nr:hypothetical protein CIPAW_13G064400 [Carya illinoinensis]
MNSNFPSFKQSFPTPSNLNCIKRIGNRETTQVGKKETKNGKQVKKQLTSGKRKQKEKKKRKMLCVTALGEQLGNWRPRGDETFEFSKLTVGSMSSPRSQPLPFVFSTPDLVSTNPRSHH